jgi:putative spermidine/putrescine transport system permease protein
MIRPEKLTNYLLTLPAGVLIMIFLLLPMASILILSFYTNTASGYVQILTPRNYGELLTKATGKILLTTLRLSGLTILTIFVAAYPIAYTLAYKVRSPRKQTFVLLLLTVPFLMDYSIRTVSWYPILGVSGLVNYLLLQVGATKTPVNLLFSEGSLMLIWVQTYLLFMMTPIYLALVKIAPSTKDAARTLGASPWQAFWRVTLPLSLPGVVVGVIYVLVSTISDFATPELFGGGIQTIGLEIAQRAAAFTWPTAAAFGVLLIAIVLGTAYVIIRFIDIQQLF